MAAGPHLVVAFAMLCLIGTPGAPAVGGDGTGGGPAGSEKEGETARLVVYKVNRTVAEFPDEEDFSTPEATYAAFTRALVTGDPTRWGELCARSLRRKLRVNPPRTQKMQVERARACLNARIVEVHVLRGTYAQVIAELPEGVSAACFRTRSFALEEGRWLNEGESAFRTLDGARRHCRRLFARRLPEPAREESRQAERRLAERAEDPDAYLERFTGFLKDEGEDPKRFVMRALAEHRLVIMGEVHHRPLYWAFNASLVADPLFAQRVGTIYMELPANGQALVEEFLAAEELDVAPLIEVLRDMLWMGWPDQAMLDFFEAVWTANRKLPPERRLRIVLVDMERLWSEIHERADWQAYNVSRDDFMAHNVLEDLRRHPDDECNALFIVGVGHAMLGLARKQMRFAVDSAGWRLRRELGADQVFAIFPHQAVQTNMGQVHGRLQRGLFGAAFAELQNRPIAFPLDTGPFGELPFDALPDKHLSGTYRDGYSAYLYLGPLEEETFSALIPGFYTDEFVQELERRHQVTFGKPWSETYGREPSAASFVAWMGGRWGRPRRRWRDGLGPVDAWRKPEPDAGRALSGTKQELIALVENWFRHNARDLTARKSLAWGEVQTDADGYHSIRCTFYATEWGGEPLLTDGLFTFSPEGELVSLQKGDVHGTDEVLRALVEHHLRHKVQNVTAREAVEWSEVQKAEDGNYSIRHTCRATMADGQATVLDQLFTFDRQGNLLRVTDLPDVQQ
ncbi:MAG: hypothetical protein PVJ27_08955 [Candidatus Brocadiaceae bacterium]